MIRCLIIDDEPFARKIILEYCKYLPQLQVLGECANALEARKALLEQAVDIIFLDIHMPVMDGFGFLKTLPYPPQVIFTTAYKEYAANAFDVNACDYLIKPFTLERFIMAIDKATKQLEPTVSAGNSPAPDYFFLKTDGRIHKLFFNEVLYAEANGNYTKIVTTGQQLMPKMPFSEYEELLPVTVFARIHRSFIINLSKIRVIEGNTVHLDKYQIPIGSNYKESLLKILKLTT